MGKGKGFLGSFPFSLIPTIQIIRIVLEFYQM